MISCVSFIFFFFFVLQLTSPIASHPIPMDDVVSEAYNQEFKYYQESTSISGGTGAKSYFPIVAAIASPGSGKSYFAQVFAQDKVVLEEWFEKTPKSTEAKEFYEVMKVARRIIITYNNWSIPTFQEDHNDPNDPIAYQYGTCLRILFRFILLVFISFHSFFF